MKEFFWYMHDTNYFIKTHLIHFTYVKGHGLNKKPPEINHCFLFFLVKGNSNSLDEKAFHTNESHLHSNCTSTQLVK